MGAATYPAGETAVIVAGTHLLAWGFVSAAFEAGIVGGSLIARYRSPAGAR